MHLKNLSRPVENTTSRAFAAPVDKVFYSKYKLSIVFRICILQNAIAR